MPITTTYPTRSYGTKKSNKPNISNNKNKSIVYCLVLWRNVYLDSCYHMIRGFLMRGFMRWIRWIRSWLILLLSKIQGRYGHCLGSHPMILLPKVDLSIGLLMLLMVIVLDPCIMFHLSRAHKWPEVSTH